MKRILLGGLALGVAAFAVPAAQATSTDVIHGGCFFDTNSQATATNGAYVGVIGDRSVTTTGDTPPALIGATVTCEIEVGTNLVASTAHTYGTVGVTGVEAGSDQISFTAAPTDIVSLCQTVNYADGSSTSACNPATSVQIPPQVVIDTLNQTVDPTVCPILAAHAGSYPGGVTIDSTGDVTVPDPANLGLNPVYDCPPYVTN